MKHVWKMLMAALLVCMLLLPAGAMADTLYGEANQDDVRVLNTPAMDGTTVFTIEKGYEFEIVEPILNESNTTVEWFRIWCKHPTLEKTYEVYIPAIYVSFGITPDGNESAGAPSVGEDPDDKVTMKPSTDSTLGGGDDGSIEVTGLKGKTSLNVGMYDKPSTDGKLVVTIPADTEVEVLTIPSSTATHNWYGVKYNGKTGYVPRSMLELIMVEDKEEDDKDEVEVILPAIGKGVTQNTNGVNLRKEPSKESTSLGKLTAGIEVELLSIPEKFDSNHWFMVRYKDQVGYIQAPYIKVPGGDQPEDKPTDTPTDDPDDLTGVIGIIVNTNGVNFRKGASTEAESMGLLKADTVVQVLQIPEKFDSKHWFKVRYDGDVGYIQAPYVRVPSLEGEDDPTDTPTDDPDDEYKVLFEGVVVNTNGLNFRKGPGTNYESMKQLPAGTKVGILAVPEKFDKNHWFKILYSGDVGYVQAPYVKVEGLTDKPTDAPSDEPTIDPDDAVVKYLGVVIDSDGLNFRKEMNVESESMAQFKSGTVLEIVDGPIYDGKVHWYCVRHDGKIGYVQAPYVYVPGVALPDEKPTATPDVEVIGTGVIQNTNGVNFRKKADINSDSMGKLKSGVPVDILEIPEKIDNSHWFKISYDGKIGYILSPYVRVLVGGEEDLNKPTATPEWDDDVVGVGMITGTNGVNLREGPSVHYDSLGKLTTGATVQLLKIPSGTDTDSWFKIRYNGKDGYVQAPYVFVLEGEVPKDEGINGAIGIGVVTSSNGVNFRTGPSKEYGTMGKIPADTAVDLLSIPAKVDEDHWYRVVYNGKTGYVQSPFIRVVSVDADALPDVSLFGYAKLMESSANLRDSASGTTVVSWKGKGSLLRIAGNSVTNGYYEWIPVFYPADSAIYYVRADMVQIVTVEDGQIVTPTPAPASRYGYVITTGQNVNLRIQPEEESFAQIPKGTVLVCVADPLDPWNSNYTWYEVKYNGMTGFVRGDFVTVCDRNGNPLENETDKPGEDEKYEILGYIKVTPLTAGNRVHLRDKQAGNSLALLDGGLILPVIEKKTPAGIYGQYSWYKVKTADGLIGYMRGDCVVECDESGKPIVATPTPAPTESIAGYILVTGNNVYVRQQPFGVALTQVKTNTVWPIVGAPKTSNGITWYNIKANGQTGYIHGDYARKLTKDEEAAYEANGTIPDGSGTPATYGNYVITVNTNGLNLRASYSQDSNSLYKVKSGVVMEYIGTKQVGTVTWYNVIYKDIELWAHGGYLEVMTEEDYKAYLAQNPDFLPNVNDNLGYVKTLETNVAVRNAANGSKKIYTISTKGLVVPYYTEKISAGGDNWYRVYVDSKFGYVRADQVMLCDAKGDPLPDPTPDLSDSAPKTQQESSYSTLKKGNSGDAVTNLVQELINQGFYKGKVTSSFTTAVKEAVEAFQEAHGLDADGIADSATQHALYGTVPIGAGDTNNLSFPIYPVEKIDWFDGGIQQLIPRGSNFKIYDVKTGIVWWAHRWAGSYHADIETLTRADSNRLCQIYGVSSLEQIVKDNLWQRRPCLVTIGTRTFACSLDGMQHNPDGDTIGNNGMDGQVCLHFTNSKGHNSGEVSESHTEAIQYAYDHAPNGKK